MLRSLRYQNPVIREHLASHYAMGLLTPLVKKRVLKLMQQDAEFEKEVIIWQERLSPLNQLAPEREPPKNLKQKVMQSILPNSEKNVRRWWQNLIVWQGTAIASLALMVFVVVSPVLKTDEVGVLSYVAVMQSSVSNEEAPLVISAYSKTKDAPSRLELRWNDRSENTDLDATTLWAVERDTGKQIALTALTPGQKSIDLNASQWQAVKGSLELVIVRGTQFDGDVVLRGLCLQLASWQS